MIDYRQAGVDPSRASGALAAKAQRIAQTFGPQVIPNPGGFGGLFALSGYRDPVLVAATDGVGTKLKLAVALDRHDTIGVDLVAMSVNDLIVQGARPLFFLDYVAAGRLVPARLEAIIEGVVRGCQEAGCALLGGETAEMPGVYAGDDYDLAGFAVGCVERDRLLTGAEVQPGDALVGIASSGVHANGFSLVRKVLEQAGLAPEARPADLEGRTLGEALLEPTRIYARPILALLDDAELGPAVRGLAHITGDGIPGNLPRMLPPGCGAVVEVDAWPKPPVFELLQQAGPIADDEMYRVFNMGLGMVALVRPDAADAAVASLRRAGEEAFRVGAVTEGGGVTLR